MLGGLRDPRIDFVRTLRPDCALVDPCADETDLLGAQRLSLRRHGVVFLQCRDAPHERAERTLAGGDDAAIVAAIHGAGPGGQRQAALVLLKPVAFVAGLLEQRLDVPHEIHRPCCRWWEARIDMACDEMCLNAFLRKEVRVDRERQDLPFKEGAPAIALVAADLDRAGIVDRSGLVLPGGADRSIDIQVVPPGAGARPDDVMKKIVVEPGPRREHQVVPIFRADSREHAPLVFAPLQASTQDRPVPGPPSRGGLGNEGGASGPEFAVEGLGGAKPELNREVLRVKQGVMGNLDKARSVKRGGTSADRARTRRVFHRLLIDAVRTGPHCGGCIVNRRAVLRIAVFKPEVHRRFVLQDFFGIRIRAGHLGQGQRGGREREQDEGFQLLEIPISAPGRMAVRRRGWLGWRGCRELKGRECWFELLLGGILIGVIAGVKVEGMELEGLAPIRLSRGAPGQSFPGPAPEGGNVQRFPGLDVGGRHRRVSQGCGTRHATLA